MPSSPKALAAALTKAVARQIQIMSGVGGLMH